MKLPLILERERQYRHMRRLEDAIQRTLRFGTTRQILVAERNYDHYCLYLHRKEVYEGSGVTPPIRLF